MSNFDQQLEKALERRTVMRAPPHFTSDVIRLVARQTLFKKEPGLFLARAAWINDAALVLVLVGLSLAWGPARLGKMVMTGVDWLVSVVDAIGSAPGAHQSAPLVLAALMAWVAGMLLWNWMDLMD